MMKIIRGIVAVVLGVPLLALVLAMLFGPPVMVVLESIDMARMQGRAQGQIDAVKIEAGGKGTSRALIRYHFDVAGRRVISDRYLPGIAGNGGAWSGGANVANDFPVGGQVTVYYSAANPELCALEYGWFKWSVFPILFFGGLAAVFASDRIARSPAARARLRYAAWGAVVYGFGLIFLGPSAVRPRDLHWHALAWCAAVFFCVAYTGMRRATMPKPEQAADADRNPAAAESTFDLYLGLVFVTGITLSAIIPMAWMLISGGIFPVTAGTVIVSGAILVFGVGGSTAIWGIAKELYRRRRARVIEADDSADGSQGDKDTKRTGI